MSAADDTSDAAERLTYRTLARRYGLRRRRHADELADFGWTGPGPLVPAADDTAGAHGDPLAGGWPT